MGARCCKCARPPADPTPPHAVPLVANGSLRSASSPTIGSVAPLPVNLDQPSSAPVLPPQTASAITHRRSDPPQIASAITRGRSAPPQTGSAITYGRGAPLHSGSAITRGTSAPPQAGSAINHGGCDPLQAASAITRGRSAPPQARSAINHGGRDPLQTASAITRGRSASPQTGSAIPHGKSAPLEIGSATTHVRTQRQVKRWATVHAPYLEKGHGYFGDGVKGLGNDRGDREAAQFMAVRKKSQEAKAAGLALVGQQAAVDHDVVRSVSSRSSGMSIRESIKQREEELERARSEKLDEQRRRPPPKRSITLQDLYETPEEEQHGQLGLLDMAVTRKSEEDLAMEAEVAAKRRIMAAEVGAAILAKKFDLENGQVAKVVEPENGQALQS